MEFLLYLTPHSQDIYNLISQKIKVVENTPICRQHNIYGWFDSKKRLMTFCTETIKSSSNPSHYINETLNHESVHVAQYCKSGDGYLEPLGISPSSMPLVEHRKNDLKKSVSIFGSNIKNIDHEAFWMEDKPNEVKYVVEKYCF